MKSKFQLYCLILLIPQFAMADGALAGIVTTLSVAAGPIFIITLIVMAVRKAGSKNHEKEDQ